MTPTTTTTLEALYAHLPEAWQRAMQRAISDHLYTEVRLEWVDDDGAVAHYSVPSISYAPGSRYDVTMVNEQISGCTCPGWRGRSCPCKHAGAVAFYRIVKGLERMEKRSGEESVVEAPRVRRTQMYRSEVA